MDSVLNIITGATGALGTSLFKKIDKNNSIIISRNNSTSYQNGFKIRCDLSKPEEYESLGKEIVSVSNKMQPTQINIIHMAGILINEKTNEKFIADDWTNMFNVNCLSFYFLAKTVYFIANKNANFNSGSFVAITSNLTSRVNHNNPGYIATKAALESIVKQLAYDMGSKNIRSNGIAPGYFPSQMSKDVKVPMQEIIMKNTPLQRCGTADDISDIIAFLLSENSAWITGQIILADGGNTIGF
ncbi:MAG: SDR family oxidoreductase [Bacteroidales bacterium]|jgi:3-oxoacyl-[acyl-carrier protein] reductase|nr:SDR family oxidoreductase [Bacteroidales bacterium]